MKELVVTKAAVTTYLQFLKIQEKSKGTLEKYQRELLDLAKYLAGKKVTREDLVVWKEELEKRYSPAGVNGRLVAANGFFSFFGRYDLRLKLLKIQKEIFMREEKELTRAEYGRLVRTAERKGKERLSLLIQTICATGIRVSELEFITVEAVKRDLFACAFAEKAQSLCSQEGHFRRGYICGKKRTPLAPWEYLGRNEKTLQRCRGQS